MRSFAEEVDRLGAERRRSSRLHALMNARPATAWVASRPAGQRRAWALPRAFAGPRGDPRRTSPMSSWPAPAISASPPAMCSGYLARAGQRCQDGSRPRLGRGPSSTDFGWIGFDPANALCPTDAHVRAAIGLDYAARRRCAARARAAEVRPVNVARRRPRARRLPQSSSIQAWQWPSTASRLGARQGKRRELSHDLLRRHPRAGGPGDDRRHPHQCRARQHRRPSASCISSTGRASASSADRHRRQPLDHANRCCRLLPEGVPESGDRRDSRRCTPCQLDVQGGPARRPRPCARSIASTARRWKHAGVTFDVAMLLGGRDQAAADAPLHGLCRRQFHRERPSTRPILQIGEHKYGKPILDRAVTYETELYDALEARADLDGFDHALQSRRRPADRSCVVTAARRLMKPSSTTGSKAGEPYFHDLRERWSARAASSPYGDTATAPMRLLGLDLPANPCVRQRDVNTSGLKSQYEDRFLDRIMPASPAAKMTNVILPLACSRAPW